MCRRRGVQLPLGAVCTIVLLLVLAQLLLPSIAAFPAIKLLFGQADNADVSVGTLTAGSQQAGRLLSEMQGVGTINATVRRLDEHGLILKDVTLRKRGSAAAASATVSSTALKDALPLNMALDSRSLGAAGIALSGNFTVLGHKINAQVGVATHNGAIVLHPLLHGLASLLDGLNVTVFRSPAVSIRSVSSRHVSGGFRLSAMAAFR